MKRTLVEDVRGNHSWKANFHLSLAGSATKIGYNSLSQSSILASLG